MSEQPAILAREAKSIYQSLKELLKTKEPFDKEIDFQRKNLRRRYLNLLLVHPYAKESKDVENHLWMQTSHAFIAVYKQRISALDRIIQNNKPAQQHQRQGSHGPVEYRKLIQRFRQFLADEEKFWTQLVVRLCRSFSLTEAHPALVALGIITSTDDLVSNAPDITEAGEGVIHASTGRNHFQFPPEEISMSLAPATALEREGRLAIVSKALICLGDIARYRELYNEAGGRPKAGHEENGPLRKPRARRGGAPLDAIPRPRNYDKAQQCYEQARLLVPHEGNPWHQLAILASYKKDSFASLVYYYRALCVRQPYDTAAENLGIALTKALEQWRVRTKRERENPVEDPQLPIRVKIELFKEQVVVLHALWRIGLDKGIDKMDAISRNHGQIVFDEFLFLVSERHLPTDLISNAIVLSQSALWKHRMFRDTPSTNQGRKPEAPVSAPGSMAAVESRIFLHLLDLHRALLEVGKNELREPPPTDVATNDLAQRITATFRRTLPALKIASKWLRANLKYAMQDPEFIAIQEKEKRNGIDISKANSAMISGSSVNTQRFWQTYCEFIQALFRAFPVDSLPQLIVLDEDIDMRGFLPLRKLMGEVRSNNQGETLPIIPRPTGEQPHPNDEQLMRIADILDDANVLAQMENSPIGGCGGQIYLRLVDGQAQPFRSTISIGRNNEVAAAVRPQQNNHTSNSIRHTHLQKPQSRESDDDNMTEATSRTDEEVLRDAFSVLNSCDQEADMDDDDEEEIVWDPRGSASPVVPSNLPSPTSHTSPITPVREMLSPIRATPRSPTHTKTMAPLVAPTDMVHVAPTTAQDLLNDVMGVSRTGISNHSESSAPQPPFLFGSELSNRPGTSIWSASRDERPLKFVGSQASPIRSHQYSGSSSQDMSQSIWTSPYPNGPQGSQHNHGAPPLSIPPQHVGVIGSHQRGPSSSIAPSQLGLGHHQGHHDPFTYSSPPHQQLMSRVDVHPSMPSGYANGQSHEPASYYDISRFPGGYAHQMPLHDPRLQTFAPPSTWGNPG